MTQITFKFPVTQNSEKFTNWLSVNLQMNVCKQVRKFETSFKN